MIVETRVHELLSRWEAAGVKPTPEELCADHPELLDEVRSQIDRLRTVDRQLHEATQSEPPAPPEIPGYTTSELIGSGGMGLVWRAKQLGTQRDVALKVISAGAFTSPRARARFEREVELASRLNHPNIARVYDSGIHLGRLYYAMELIDGQPLDRFVESANFEQTGIVQLMRTICDAVHHAHQLGVIHRDLKPSNILVDSAGQPHVLDFGVAKEVESNGNAQITLENDAPGTPAYMSPEQAAGHTTQVGTGSDVYTLGVILYQLLLKRLPHDTAGTSIEVMHRIATSEPCRPRDVSRALDPDLEAILIKALAHDPAERYASANELGNDLGRFIAHLPVIARRQTIAYLLRKRFVRHKWKVIGAAALIAAAIGFVSWSIVNLERERRTTSAVNVLLERLLTASDPAIAKNANITVRQVLDRAAADVSTTLIDQPLVEAQVRTTIGRAYMNLSQRGVAPDEFRRVRAIYEHEYGRDDRRTLRAEADLAMALEGEGMFDAAERAQIELHERCRRALGERDADTIMCRHRLGNVYAEGGRLAEAESLFRETLQMRTEVLGIDHPDTIWSMSDLGAVMSRQGNASEAERLLRDALQLRLKNQGPDSIDTLNAEMNLASALFKQNKIAEAEPMLLSNVKTRRRVYGQKHADVSLPLGRLAEIRIIQERYDDAIAYALEAFELRFATDRFTSPRTMEALRIAVQAMVADGRTIEAKQKLQIADDEFTRSAAAGNARSFTGVRAYIAAVEAVGDRNKAIEVARIAGPSAE